MQEKKEEEKICKNFFNLEKIKVKLDWLCVKELNLFHNLK